MNMLTSENAPLLKELIEAAVTYANCDVDDQLAQKTEDDLHKAAISFAMSQDS